MYLKCVAKNSLINRNLWNYDLIYCIYGFLNKTLSSTELPTPKMCVFVYKEIIFLFLIPNIWGQVSLYYLVQEFLYYINKTLKYLIKLNPFVFSLYAWKTLHILANNIFINTSDKVEIVKFQIVPEIASFVNKKYVHSHNIELRHCCN